MALTRRFNSTRSKQVRRQADLSPKEGCGDDIHMLTGVVGTGATRLIYRSLVAFAHDWSAMARVVKVELFVKTEKSSTHFSFGPSPTVRTSRITSAFSDGVNAENVWTSGDYQWPGVAGVVDTPIANQDELWVPIDITGIAYAVAPKGLPFPAGRVGAGLVDYGWVLYSPNEASTSQRCIFHAYDVSGTVNDPYILVTYDPINRAPNAPVLTNPPTTNDTFGQSFEGTHSDPDGDPMAARNIVVYPAGGSTAAWTLPPNLQTAGSDETQTGVFSVPLSLATGSLKLQTAYEWVAQTRDPAGLWGPFSARRALLLTSSAPTVVATSVPPIAVMATVKFGGAYSDPESNPLAQFQLQMQAAAAHSDPSWLDSSAFVWDTGETLPTSDEIASRVIARAYGGRPLGVGSYTYRIKAQDSTGVWSAWSYADISLTAPYDPDPGNITLTTQVARRAPVRIALFKMGTGRGPGALIGYIDDPIDLGASRYLNGAGEVYFTLPALHPYCPYVQARQTHYQVQQYYGDRYRPIFAGVINDFHADGNDMVAYGVDYLGLLQTAVDERYNPAATETESNMAGGGGSKYVNRTLDAIIRDQLTYHKAIANSPVGFITIGTLTALAERATIFSTYAAALPFIEGLIRSHKQGTGREARFYEFPKDTTFLNWEWRLTDNWGRDRPNIQLEYGGLLNDFEIVALGDFGTRMLGVGQKRGEVKVYRAVGASGLDESIWGRTAKTAFYADIIDQNDLQRRVNEDAMQAAKIGKRIGLAIAADMLAPFDGWDLGDNIILNIVRGVVDTSRYGSAATPYPGGYWSVQGVEWNYSSDGHSELTLTVLPKKTATAPDSSLIPSVNPGLGKEWQVGYGVPSTYGSTPSATPPPAGLFSAEAQSESMGLVAAPAVTTYPLSTDPVNAKNYQDLNSGCVYELDETVDPMVYNEVYCPPSGGGGTVPPPDTTPPPAPTIKSWSSTTTGQEDGTSITNLAAQVGYATPPTGLADLDQISLQTTRFSLPGVEPPQPDWSLAAQWLAASTDRTGTLDTSVVQPTALAVTPYWIRALAIDVAGNRSGWSAILQVTTAGDTIGPPQPSGIVVQSGMSTIGLRWAPIEVDDLDYVEVQWRVSPSGPWTSVQVHGTITIISGLTNETTYDLRLRSVDTSGNILYDTGTTDADGNPIFASAKADDQPEQGWVIAPQGHPATLHGDALVWDSATIGRVFAGQINADWITAGTLRVGGSSGNAAAITVYDSTGHLIGRWSTAGIEVWDPANPQYKLVITASSLYVYDLTDPANPVTLVSLSPLGIDAASITFGSARGGHNLVQNSSFEMGKFGVTSIVNSVWDVAADWNAAGSRQGADTNITTGASALTMTTV